MITFTDYKNAKPMLHVIGYIINWCSAFINPFIYVFSNKIYMASFKKTIKFHTFFTTWSSRRTKSSRRPREIVPNDGPDVEKPIIKNQKKKETEETEV